MQLPQTVSLLKSMNLREQVQHIGAVFCQRILKKEPPLEINDAIISPFLLRIFSSAHVQKRPRTLGAARPVSPPIADIPSYTHRSVPCQPETKRLFNPT